MGRPRLKFPKRPVKLTLSPTLRADAEKLAYDHNESLSGLVERLLRAHLATPPSLPTAADIQAAETETALELNRVIAKHSTARRKR